MAAIGRALIGNSSLLLLDEPSEGIQPSIVGQIEQHILALKRDLDLTILVVEQDVQLIKAVADTCYIIDHGVTTQRLDRSQFAETDLLERNLEF